MFQAIRCALKRHIPKRSRASFDGELFRAPCRGCGAPMIREADGWRLAPDAPTRGPLPRGWPFAAFGALLLPAAALGYALAPRHIEIKQPPSVALWRHR